jgi:acyl-CoA synthetase (AMP-forming)/AMP-acid ligase II
VNAREALSIVPAPSSRSLPPFALTAPALFDWAAHEYPDAVLTMLSADRITVSEAARRSRELAAALLAGGVGKGTRVGVLGPNGPELCVALMAVTRIGAVAVPINTFFVPAELAWVVRDADVQVLLTVESLLTNDYPARLELAIPELATAVDPWLVSASLPYLRRIHVFGGSARKWAWSLPEPVDNAVLDAAEARVHPADDHLVIYTSGSTAQPKGVIHTQSSVIRQSWLIASEHDWHPGDHVYMPLPYFWIGGYVYGFLAAMLTGATTVCELRFDPAATLAMLARERVTVTMGWPHVGTTLAIHPDFAKTDLSRLKGPYHQALVPPARRVSDASLLVEPLGMTETATSHTWWPPTEPLPPEKRGSLGKAAPGFEHEIIDEAGDVVPVGDVGEICVRGPGLMRGIVGRERRDVFDADGWFHTADAGWVDADGYFYFTGRLGDLVKTAGASVSPIEVETVLRAFPEVQEASVIGLPDPVLGQIVCGVVVLRSGAALAETDLRDRCRATLSAYKVPKRWVFLDAADVPFTASDKIDKAALVERLTDTEP